LKAYVIGLPAAFLRLKLMTFTRLSQALIVSGAISAKTMEVLVGGNPVVGTPS
jgi:hypothetical protein